MYKHFAKFIAIRLQNIAAHTLQPGCYARVADHKGRQITCRALPPSRDIGWSVPHEQRLSLAASAHAANDLAFRKPVTVHRVSWCHDAHVRVNEASSPLTIQRGSPRAVAELLLDDVDTARCVAGFSVMRVCSCEHDEL